MRRNHRKVHSIEALRGMANITGQPTSKVLWNDPRSDIIHF
ncbi:MAG TPA: hypothetical protein VE733_24260 [Streptosporangiaceae bacterium]|jgi:hypothetical protein|nr:hypothetical protein [Streptosporangiaceae bacterium]